jgi:hypothetical protein
MKFLKKSWKNMAMFFSVCSFIYAMFYVIVMVSNMDIKYVEDIVSLNIQKLRDVNVDTKQEGTVILDKSYQIKQVE